MNTNTTSLERMTPASAEYDALSNQLIAIAEQIRDTEGQIKTLKASPSTKGLGALERQLKNLNEVRESIVAERAVCPGAPKIRTSYLAATLVESLKTVESKFDGQLDEFVKNVKSRGLQTHYIEWLAECDARHHYIAQCLTVIENKHYTRLVDIYEVVVKMASRQREQAIRDLDPRNVVEVRAVLKVTEITDYFTMDGICHEWFYIESAMRHTRDDDFEWDDTEPTAEQTDAPAES